MHSPSEERSGPSALTVPRGRGSPARGQPRSSLPPARAGPLRPHPPPGRQPRAERGQRSDRSVPASCCWHRRARSPAAPPPGIRSAPGAGCRGRGWAAPPCPPRFPRPGLSRQLRELPGRPRCLRCSSAWYLKNSLKMNFFLETCRAIGLLVYYLLESLVFFVVPKRKKNVSDEIVLITGAGSGIGRLLSLKFARLGATVVLWDINQEGLKETSRLARENGGVQVHSYICDCSKRQDVYRVADQVKKEVGDVSILVNNAGIVTGKKFIDSPDSLVEKTMEVNIMAHFWTYKAFLPAMMASNHGHLVSVASSAGLNGVNGLSDYCASKFAAVGFAESVDLEMRDLGKTGVKTTIVCPYIINTGMFDGCGTKWPRLIPVLEPEYVAEKIMTAIRRDQQILVLPRSLHILLVLRNIIPVKVAVLLADYFGYLHIMDTFEGRAKKD